MCRRLTDRRPTTPVHPEHPRPTAAARSRFGFPARRPFSMGCQSHGRQPGGGAWPTNHRQAVPRPRRGAVGGTAATLGGSVRPCERRLGALWAEHKECHPENDQQVHRSEQSSRRPLNCPRCSKRAALRGVPARGDLRRRAGYVQFRRGMRGGLRAGGSSGPPRQPPSTVTLIGTDGLARAIKRHGSAPHGCLPAMKEHGVVPWFRARRSGAQDRRTGP